MNCYTKLVVSVVCLGNLIALVLIYHYTIGQLCVGYTATSTHINANKLGNRYVSFGKSYKDGRGLGNLIFDFAATLHVSELTGRQPTIFNSPDVVSIREVFELGIVSYDEEFLCPCQNVGEKRALSYDDQFEELHDSGNRTLMLMGFYQSWKYTRTMDRLLRSHLVFKHRITQVVDRFLSESVPKNWIKGFVRVGIHVRRGDIVTESSLATGYTVPNKTYFVRAMTYFANRFASPVQFIVASDDMAWCRKRFDGIVRRLNSGSGSGSARRTSKKKLRHGIVYADNFSGGEHLALLASCDHVIMSTGTFGWWAAWLAKGETVYYADWPRKGSSLASVFDKDDFFPPSWIGMS